ncbi:hypothetical protein VSX64_24580 [Aurantimonas sp. C2-6-R+9]|nr:MULTISPECIES: hypothetical protein [unclassified Aurantimonas]MEC5291485.1 hypothetical protein [Aurantimonas sp. C2-3-R2]MEC5383890.1 hypothetical protein [Aurantimonas sp. C2-6-R+9]MEC5412572.1 hypothetical protein [Aurantimonas sp. C2-4-R8]
METPLAGNSVSTMWAQGQLLTALVAPPRSAAAVQTSMHEATAGAFGG